ITTDAAGAINFLNPVAEALTGWTDADAAGRSMAEVFRIVHETTRETVQNPVDKVLEHGGIVGLANHTTLIARDGSERSIDDSAAPIHSADGEFVGCILVFRDITERRRQEVRLDEARSLLESVLAAGNVGTWSWDLASGEIALGENAGRIFGIAPGRPRRGNLDHFLVFIHPDDRDPVHREVGRAIEEAGRYEVEHRVIHPGGEVRWIVARGQVRCDDDGKPSQLPGVIVDITDQKRLQGQLADAKARLDHLLSAGSVATWTWDIARNRVVADRNLAGLFSVTPEEAEGGQLQSYTRAIHPADRDRVGRAILAAIAEGSGYDEQYRIVRPGGEVRWVVARGSIERDGAGRAVSLNGVVIDTTDRHLAESEARERENFQRLIFESVKDFSIFTTDLDGIITSWNQGAENVFGFRKPEAVGQPAAIVFTPEDRAAGIPEQEMRSAAEVGRGTDERWHLRKDGSRFFASGMVRPLLDPDGSLIGFTKVARDVTAAKVAEEALRESEGRYRSLFTSIDEGYCVIQVIRDEAGRAVDWRFLELNPAFERQTGFVDAAGKRMREIIPDHDEFWFETYGRIAQAREPLRFQYGGASMNGQTFDLYAFPIGEPAEQKVAVLFTNITHRVRNRAERERLVEQLTDADRRKDEFLAMLAHELRNPLGAISPAIRLVESEGRPELLAEVRDTIRHQVGHLTHLIDDLLDVSRITQGKIELRRRTVELTAITRKAAELAQPQVDEKRHELAVSAPDAPVAFVADPTRVEQMISNLLTNAAKYSEPGRAIHLSAGVEGAEVVFRVRDQGFGISAEMLPKVFGLFTQVDATLDRARGGLGIGLTLVRTLAEMHGGSITAFSEGEGRGSEFTLRLPIGEPGAAPPSPPAAADPKPRDLPARLRILIIDDSRDTARMTSRLLSIQGHALMAAHDGFDGIEAAKAYEPDVILLDIGLPGMNGFEVAAAIRDHECCRDSVIVAVSGYGENAARDRSKAVGIDHHLTKPLDFDALDVILREAHRRAPDGL
ncbi:MAG: PAS domain S-box protein, partial [Parafilimonas terrae]|nr:PAS domain S-box protein [Parafilimonas terrae]